MSRTVATVVMVAVVIVKLVMLIMIAVMLRGADSTLMQLLGRVHIYLLCRL